MRLILIWYPLKFYHFWALQIKLSNFGRSTPPQELVSLAELPTKLISIKSMVIYLKKSLLFLYKFKFSEAYILLDIDLGPIKVLSFWDFVDQTE